MGEAEEDHSVSWAYLPDHIIVKIFSFLNLQDRFQAAFICKTWNDCFNLRVPWSGFVFIIQDDNEKQATRHRKFLDVHGSHLKQVLLKVDQSKPLCRTVACEILNEIADLPDKQLSAVKIDFIGENPFFYAGAEFVQALKRLFGCNPENMIASAHSLLHVDLSGIPVSLDDEMLNLLSENHPLLESLNILNKVLECKVSAECIVKLVRKCKKLKKLFIFYCSLCSETLVALAEDHRTPLEILGISCWRETIHMSLYDKFDLSSLAFLQLKKKVPGLKIALSFDHTIPVRRVYQIMKPEIPVHVLDMQNFNRIYKVLSSVTSFYYHTLEVLVLHTKNSPQLEKALVHLAKHCSHLHTLIVYCVLKKDVVDKILKLRPEMKRDGTYILKWDSEAEP